MTHHTSDHSPVGQKKRLLAEKVGTAYLLYLGILPALATFGVQVLYPGQHSDGRIFFLFLTGVAAVGVYLAFMASYTILPTSLPKLLLLWLDAPLFALLALLSSQQTSFFFWLIDSFLIDGVTIFLSIMVLAWFSLAPTREQRIASTLIMLLCLGFCTLLFYPYLRNELWGNGWRLFWLGSGLVEAGIVNYRLVSHDEVQRDTDFSGIYIAALVMVWVGALILGNIPELGKWIQQVMGIASLSFPLILS